MLSLWQKKRIWSCLHDVREDVLLTVFWRDGHGIEGRVPSEQRRRRQSSVEQVAGDTFVVLLRPWQGRGWRALGPRLSSRRVRRRRRGASDVVTQRELGGRQTGGRGRALAASYREPVVDWDRGGVCLPAAQAKQAPLLDHVSEGGGPPRLIGRLGLDDRVHRGRGSRSRAGRGSRGCRRGRGGRLVVGRGSPAHLLQSH